MSGREAHEAQAGTSTHSVDVRQAPDTEAEGVELSQQQWKQQLEVWSKTVEEKKLGVAASPVSRLPSPSNAEVVAKIRGMPRNASLPAEAFQSHRTARNIAGSTKEPPRHFLTFDDGHDVDTVKDQLLQAKREAQEYRQKSTDLKVQIQKLEVQLRRKDRSIQNILSFQAEAAPDKTTHVNALRSEKLLNASMAAKVKSLENQLRDRDDELNSLKDSTRYERIVEMKATTQRAVQELDRLKQLLRSSARPYARGSDGVLAERIVELETALSQQQEENKQLRKSNATLSASATTSDEQQRDLQDLVESHETATREWNRRAKAYQEKISRLQATGNELESRLRESEVGRAGQESECERLKQKLHKTETDAQAQSAKHLAKINDLQAELEIVQGRLSAATSGKVEADLVNERELRVKTEKKVHELESALVKREKDAKQDAIALHELRVEVDERQTQLTDAGVVIANQEEQISALQKQLAQAEARSAQLQRDIDDLHKAATASGSERDAQHEQIVAKLREELKAAKAEGDALRRNHAAEVQQLQENSTKLQAELSALHKKETEARQSAALGLQVVRDKEERLLNLQQQCDTLQKETRHQQEALDAAHTEAEDLKATVEDKRKEIEKLRSDAVSADQAKRDAEIEAQKTQLLLDNSLQSRQNLEEQLNLQRQQHEQLQAQLQTREQDAAAQLAVMELELAQVKEELAAAKLANAGGTDFTPTPAATIPAASKPAPPQKQAEPAASAKSKPVPANTAGPAPIAKPATPTPAAASAKRASISKEAVVPPLKKQPSETSVISQRRDSKDGSRNSISKKITGKADYAAVKGKVVEKPGLTRQPSDASKAPNMASKPTPTPPSAGASIATSATPGAAPTPATTTAEVAKASSTAPANTPAPASGPLKKDESNVSVSAISSVSGSSASSAASSVDLDD